MNIERLKQGEEDFFRRYPGGFAHPDLQEIIKKHKPEKMTKMASELLAPDKFENPLALCASVVKIVSASSMVSVFEKPRFRDFIQSLNARKTAAFARGMHALLHGDGRTGFEGLQEILSEEKLAKWTLMTVCPVYYHPQREVFIKPTTVKNIISYFELPGLIYKPAPDYDFYTRYRSILLDMKSRVNPAVAPDNAAFSGFLMMVMEG